MKKDPALKRSKVIQIPVTEVEFSLIKEKAKCINKSLAEFGRLGLLSIAEKVNLIVSEEKEIVETQGPQLNN